MRRHFLRGLLLACAWGIATGALAAEAPSGLIDHPAAGDLLVYGPMAGKSLILAPEVPGRTALHIKIATPGKDSHPWDIAVAAATTEDIHKGDHIVVAVWARAASPDSQIAASMQQGDAPYTGIAQSDIHPSKAWRLFQLDGVADQDYAAGKAGVNLQLNTRQQAIDIGPIYIFRNPDPSVDLRKQVAAIALSGARDTIIETPDGVKLAATLRTPPGKGPFPAVLMVTGSGPWGRNPSDAVSLALLRHGVAVLQYDKRGVRQSTGRLDTAQYTDLVHDAGVVAAWLRRQPGIDARRTGIQGISQGGMIAISVAAADPNIHFVIDMAGPAEPFAELGIRQHELAYLDAGSPPDKVAAWVKVQHDLLAAVRASTSDDDAGARVKAALTPYLGTMIDQANIDAAVAAFRQSAVRVRYLYDPKAELERVHVPVLGLFGTMDHQVPAEENAAALRAGLHADKDVTVVILLGFNHLFQHAKIGSTAEWSTLKEPQVSDPAMLKLITDWVTAHTL